jgi:6-phosphogluconolactonase (cycloisomerase 2 family)
MMLRAWLLTAVQCLLATLLAGCGGQSGLTTNSGPTPTPTPVFASPAKFLYAANEVSASISGYSVSPSTGALTALPGFPVSSGVNPVFLTHDPLNKFLIAVDIAANNVRVYGIDSNTGALTEVPPSPYPLGMEPRAAAIDPTGKFIYVASQSLNSVAAFTMNSSGVLTAVPGSPFATGSTTAGSFGCCVVVDPTGRFVYVADIANVYAFSINASNGALTLVATVPAPTGSGLAMDPTGAFLYAVGFANSIQTYRIDSTTGAITLAVTSPTATHGSSFTIALDPAGRFAYTVEAGQTLVAYSLQNGVFTSLGDFSSGALGSSQLAIDPSGSFIYAPQTGTENDISSFQISPSGFLTPIPGSPTPSGKQPFSVTIISR